MSIYASGDIVRLSCISEVLIVPVGAHVYIFYLIKGVCIGFMHELYLGL